MARSIVLRFDATCFDCGRSLSAGTTARWFGRGRVSCCGGKPPVVPSNQADASVPRAHGPLDDCATFDGLPPLKAKPPGGSAELYRAALEAEASLPPGLRTTPPVPLSSLIPPGAPARYVDAATGKPVASPASEPAPDSELGKALSVGLSSQQAGQLGIAFPMVRLVVRLHSGARFIVRAEHVVHLCACISESMRDRIRDVMRAAPSSGTTD